MMSDKQIRSNDRIEIPPVTLLEQQRHLVNQLQRLAASLGLEFGWHYLLDLVWIISNLGQVTGKTIMDAGAGTGVIQWYLAEGGANIMSVDRSNREYLPLRFRWRYRVRGLHVDDLAPVWQHIQNNFQQDRPLRAKFASQLRDFQAIIRQRRARGQVTIYHQNLLQLDDIADNTFDAIVSVSALEHNKPDKLEDVISELMRVLKPGGVLLATLCAAKDEDWFHKPSSGWCYTEASLRRIFQLPDEIPSNYADYDELFNALRDNHELRDNLAKFYYRSGENGMPWGVWDPVYQPVGVCKSKPLKLPKSGE